MNRQNFVAHFTLAITVIMLAAFIGQMRRWKPSTTAPVTATQELPRRSCQSRASLESVATTSPAITAEPDEVIVRFKPGTSQDEIERVVARFKDRVDDRIESVNGLVFVEDYDADVNAEEVAKEYEAASSSVLYAEPDYAIELDPMEESSFADNDLEENEAGSQPNDPMFAEQWSLVNQGQKSGKTGADIKALNAWNKTKGSEKVIIAVLDSGVDYTHEDLAPNMWVRPDTLPAYQDAELGEIDDENGFDATNLAGLPDPMDDNGHGTHCAGIIGAAGDNGLGIAGINWKVQIMPLKFIGRNGSGTTKAAIEAINYVVQRKKDGVNVRVISASWGSPRRSKALEDAIRRAGDEGVIFIAAAGNDSANADKRPHFPSGYDLPNVISVAALDRNDALASFSNFGAKSVHIAAPGKEIMSTWLNNDYREASGTSMATPEVSGVAALILAQNPKMSVADLRAKLLKSVDVLPTLQGKTVTGGRLNAAKAVGAE